MGKKGLPGKKEIKLIKQYINQGMNLKEIARKVDVSFYSVDLIFADLMAQRKSRNKFVSEYMGFKDESYYTEEELITGIDYSSYTWENLTEEEKQFYLNYGTENNNRADSSLE